MTYGMKEGAVSKTYAFSDSIDNHTIYSFTLAMRILKGEIIISNTLVHKKYEYSSIYLNSINHLLALSLVISSKR